MKRCIAIILCLVMALSLVACGKNKGVADTTGQPATTQTTTTLQTTEEPAAEATETTAAETKPEETTPENTKPIQPKPTVEPTTEATQPKVPSLLKMSQKEQFETLAGVVGTDVFTVVEKLGWQERDLEEKEENLFSLPLQVYLEGTKYQVYLGIDVQTYKVSEVIYRAEFPAKMPEVARALLTTVKKLDNWIGSGNELEMDCGFDLREATEAEAATALSSEENAYAAILWDYSGHATKEQKEFIENGEAIGGRESALGVTMEYNRICLNDADAGVSDTCMINISVCTIPV